MANCTELQLERGSNGIAREGQADMTEEAQ